MSVELLSILILVAIFAISTTLGIHMGALAIAAAFILGVFIADLDVPAGDTAADVVAGGFPGDLFIILAGVTFLFAIAKSNGTVDWLIYASVRAVGGRVVYIPWIFFAITGILTGVGAVVPAAVAIIAPIGITFALRYGIHPLLMGLMVINGATAGGFSPISIFGIITNGVVDNADLEGSPLFLFLASLVFNTILGVITFVLFGGTKLFGRREDPTAVSTADGSTSEGSGSTGTGSTGTGSTGPAGQSAQAPHGSGTSTGTSGAAQSGVATTGPARAGAEDDDPANTRLTPIRMLTVAAILLVALGALFLELDPGFTAFAAAAIIAFADPAGTKGAVNQIAWPTVLLVCGIVTYVTLLDDEIGTVDWLGDNVASIGAALFAAVLILYIGGVVSAFASTTGILGALIPLAVPFLQDGEIGAIGLITALAISSSVVDSSPFSTSGSLVVANTPEDNRDFVFRRLMQWGFSMVAIVPPVTWLIFVAPGWL